MKNHEGFGDFNSADDDSSNVVDFNEWRRSHGYAAPEEVTPNETVSESAEPGTASETTTTMTAQNKDQLLVGQVKVEKPLLTFERLLKVGKFFLEGGLNSLEAQGILPPEFSKVFTFVVDEVAGSERVKKFGEKVDTYTFDDYAIERQQRKMARENGQPTADQA
ncbi:hypothetical protein IKP94_04180 [Candidatus Saccharibacteria bacterium]|nr:hypothetical protein [Candidatus Saccharibacteria bacterium]